MLCVFVCPVCICCQEPVLGYCMCGNFRGFRGMPGHPRKFNPRIMVLVITTYNKMAAYFRRTVHVAKHDYNRTKDNRFCFSLNKALAQDTSIFVHPKFR